MLSCLQKKQAWAVREKKKEKENPPEARSHCDSLELIQKSF